MRHDAQRGRLNRRYCRVIHLVGIGAVCCGIIEGADGGENPPDLDSFRKGMEQGQVETVLPRLLALEEQWAGEPKYDLLLGWAYAETGQNDQASFALERVLMLDPHQSEAHLLTARVMVTLGQPDTAKKHLLQVGDISLPTVLQQMREQLQDSLNRRDDTQATHSSTARFTGSVQVTSGYDTNVNAGPSAITLIIPSISSSTATTLGTLSKEGAWVTTASGIGGMRVPLTEKTQLIGALSVSHSAIPKRTDREEGYLTGLLGIEHLTGKEKTTLAGFSQGYTLEHGLYRSYWGGVTSWRHELGEGAGLTGYVQYLNDHYPDYASYEIQRVVGGVTHEVAAFDPRLTLSYGGHLGKETAKDAAYPQVTKSLWGGDVAGKYRLQDQWTLMGTLAYERQDYAGNDLLYSDQRLDHVWSLGTTLDWEYAKQWHLLASMSYYDNRSNLALYDYDRALVNLALRWDFADGIH
ncbi:MAG: tetratricopeptide repeat protein [Magnetococcales bacterium]|nr:tetratricopeptide repeat protein [Magnetococcales bacterium]